MNSPRQGPPEETGPGPAPLDPVGEPTFHCDLYGARYYSAYETLRSDGEGAPPAPYRWGERVWEELFAMMATEIVARLHPASTLDAGCAVGFLVKSLRDRGVDAEGIDVSDFAIAQVPAEVRGLCRVGSITEPLGRDYDLITCIEVLEHLEPAAAAAAVANLCRHAGAVLFSSTPDHYDEVTHVNVRPPWYWAGLFARSGFYRDGDFDASFVSPHAVLFRPAGAFSDVAADYERWYWEAKRELAAVRAHRDHLHSQMVSLIRERDDAVAEREALLGTKTFRLTAGLRQAWARAHGSGAAPVAPPPVVSPPTYREWIERFEHLDDAGRAELERRLAACSYRPTFSIVMPVYDPEDSHLREAIDSVLAQVYPDWELCVADDASTSPTVRPILEEYRRRDGRIRVSYRRRNGGIVRASNTALKLAAGDYVVLLDDNDLLAPQALACFALELDRHPDAVLVYSDEDKIDLAGARFQPYFKPPWNPPLLLGQNLISHVAAYRRQDVERVGGFRAGTEGSQDHDLALRVVERVDRTRVRHIPLVLYHWRAHPGSTAGSAGAKRYAVPASARAVSDHLARTRTPGAVEPALAGAGTRVRRPMPSPAPAVLVSVLATDRLVAEQSARALAALTPYPNVRFLAAGPEAPFARPGPGRPAPAEPRALAALAADTVLCSVVAGLEVISEGWLEELVAQLADPAVGMVGSRLESREGRLVGGPLALGGGGEIAAPLEGVGRADGGYFGRAWLVHEVAALGLGSVAVRSSLLDSLGWAATGTNPFMDLVDLSLRVRGAGLAVLWTPYSRLGVADASASGLPHVGAGPGLPRLPPAQVDGYRALLEEESAYSPNLDLRPGHAFQPAWPPRRPEEWGFLGGPGLP